MAQPHHHDDRFGLTTSAREIGPTGCAIPAAAKKTLTAKTNSTINFPLIGDMGDPVNRDKLSATHYPALSADDTEHFVWLLVRCARQRDI